MSLRTTLVLLILSLVATFMVARSERDRREWFVQDLDQPFNFHLESLTRIEVRGPNREVACQRELESSGVQRWHILRPVVFPASQATMERLGMTLRELRVRGELDKRRPEYGLEEGWEILFLVGPAQHRLVLGASHPELPLVYAALSESSGPSRPVLVDGSVLAAFRDLGIDELRDDGLLDIGSHRASGLVVTQNQPSGSRRIEVQRTPETWRMVTPLATDADVAEVRHLIEVLNAWSIAAYVSDVYDPQRPDDQRYGLNPARWEVAVTEEGTGRVRHLLIGADGPPAQAGGAQVYVAWAGQPHVFLASAEPLPLLTRDAQSYRDRQLVRLPEPEVKRLRVEVFTESGEPLAVELVPVGERVELRIAGGQTYPADAVLFKGIVEALRTGTVAEFHALGAEQRRNLQRYGLDQPWRIEIEPLVGTSEILLVGKVTPERPGERYLINPRWQDHYAVGVMPADRVFAGLPFSVRSRRLIEFRASLLDALNLRDRDGRSLELVCPVSTWSRRDNRQPLADQVPLSLFCEALTELEIQWGAGTADQLPGPDDFALRIEIPSLRGTPQFRPRILYVGPPLGRHERLVREGAAGWVGRLRTGAVDPFQFVIAEILAREGR